MSAATKKKHIDKGELDTMFAGSGGCPLQAPRAGFEPATYPLGGDRAIQLCHRGVNINNANKKTQLKPQLGQIKSRAFIALAPL